MRNSVGGVWVPRELWLPSLASDALEAVAALGQGSSTPNATLAAEFSGLFARPFSLPTSEHPFVTHAESEPLVCRCVCYLKALLCSQAASSSHSC